MSMQDLEKAFRLIKEKFDEEEIDLYVPQSLNLIESAEEALKTRFSKTYREFLKRFGTGGVGSFEVYGLIKDEIFNSAKIPHVTVPNVVWTTLRENKDFEHPLYLPILYDVGEGTKYCLDTSQMNEAGECPVVAWPIGGYEMTPELEIVAEDFGKFFLDRVEEQLAWKQQEQQR